MNNINFSMEVTENESFLELKGVLRAKQLQTVRERLFSALDSVSKTYFVDVEQAHFKDNGYLTLFLELLNALRGKGAELVIIFHGDENREFFNSFFNVFKIYDSRDSYLKNIGFFDKLRATGITYQRSTGIRLAPGIAVFLLLIIAGWILTLFSIIDGLDKEIREKETILGELQAKYEQSEQVIENLQNSIAPLRGLGIEIDTSSKRSLGSVQKFTDFLEKLE